MLPFISLVISHLFLIVSINHVTSVAVDPDRSRLIPDLINSRGFNHEAHYLTTSDGYILGIHRIINPLAQKYLKSAPKPILIQCGLLCSGSEFLDNSPGDHINETMLQNRHDLDSIDFSKDGNNLGFLLANLGYDVWLFHPRGNFYSRNHTILDPDTSKTYWQFTFDEIALLDLPTTIDHMIKVTGQPNIGYIGYSQGGTTVFALLADKPQYSSKLMPIINLAPAVRLDNYGGLPFQALIESRLIMDFVKNRGGECFAFMGTKFIDSCDESFAMRLVCNFILHDLLAINTQQVDEDRAKIFLAHIPSGTSCWNIIHLLQLIVRKSFAKFDYGEHDNIIIYNSTTPPVYDLAKVKSNDMYFITSVGDHSADPKDIALLKSLLTSVPSITDHNIKDKTFDHLDYFMSKHTGDYVNGPIAKMLDKYNR